MRNNEYLQSTMGDTSKSLSEKGRRGNTVDKAKWKITDTQQDSGFLPTIGVTLWMGWNGFITWIVLYAIFLADKWQRVVIVGLMTLSLVLPVDFPGTLGYRLGDWLMAQAEKYFGESAPIFMHADFFSQYQTESHKYYQLGLKTVIEDEEDLIRHSEQNKALIFAFSPHDMVRFDHEK